MHGIWQMYMYLQTQQVIHIKYVVSCVSTNSVAWVPLGAGAHYEYRACCQFSVSQSESDLVSNSITVLELTTNI